MEFTIQKRKKTKHSKVGIKTYSLAPRQIYGHAVYGNSES